MATGKFTGKKLHVSIDSSDGTLTDVSSWVYECSNPLPEIELADVTAGGGVSGYTHVPGLQKAEFTISGWMDDTAGGIWATCKGYINDGSTFTRTFVVCPAGTSAGAPSIDGECKIKQVRLDTKVKDAVGIMVDCVLQSSAVVGVSS